MSPSRYHFLRCLPAILWILAVLLPARPAAAQTDDVYELIDVINSLRASRGLAPYTVDPGLMALAQEHSEYQAATHTSTHLHSDGRTPPQIGVFENVAGGDIGWIDPQTAVYQIWADPVHMRTMVGYPEGSMGVGIANDDVTIYYTLEVRRGDKTPPAAETAVTMPLPVATLAPATPMANGSIIHSVGYGHTLWAIAQAYGVQVEQIRAWNNIPAGSSNIYAGQKLLVRPTNLVTAAPSPTSEVRNMPTPSPPPTAALPTGTPDAMPDSALPAGAPAPLFLGGGLILSGCALLMMLGSRMGRI